VFTGISLTEIHNNTIQQLLVFINALFQDSFSIVFAA